MTPPNVQPPAKPSLLHIVLQTIVGVAVGTFGAWFAIADRATLTTPIFAGCVVLIFFGGYIVLPPTLVRGFFQSFSDAVARLLSAWRSGGHGDHDP